MLTFSFSKPLPKFHIFALLIAFTVICMPLQSMAATLPPGFTETSISGLSTPTAFAIHQDGRIFVTEQDGALRVIKNGVLLPTPFTSVSTTSSGERGLLGLAIDPDYATNRYIYVYYTATTPATHNRVSRFTADPANEDVALAGSELVILDLDNLSGATNHNGGAIHFGLDGKLYVAVGDNASSANAVSLNNRLGKMLRINSDGTIPGDNPTTFPGIAGSPTGLNQAIWAVGLRNPYTFGVQPGTGRMYINDVGQNTWEEIDDAGAGINFGWPTCEGAFLQGTTTPCTNPNFTNPVYTYSSSSGSECTIIGGSFYNPTNTTFPAPYVGKYFFADYCAGWIKYVDPANPSATGAAPTFASGIGFGAVDIHVSNDGSLHYLNRSSGTIFRVLYTGNPTPTNTPTGTATATLTPTFTPTASSTPTNTPTVVPSPFPEYDLTVSQSDAPDPVVVGQQLTYTLAITNSPSALGGGACPNVRFGYPSGTTFFFNSTSTSNGYNAVPDATGITFTGGCVSSAGGTIGTAILTVTITPTSSGTLISLGTSVVVDPENNWHEDNENNNTAETITTTVTTATPTNTVTATPTASPCTVAGSLDTSFGVGGTVLTPVGSLNDGAYAVAIQSDDKIVAAGRAGNGTNYDFAITRYNTDGSLDTSFDGDGKVIIPFGRVSGAWALAIQPDGKIVAVGGVDTGTNTDFALTRYNTDGSLDTSFDIDGKVITQVGNGNDWAYAVAIQSDGKIVAAGYTDGQTTDFALTRYNTDGSLDTSFDGDGKIITPVGTNSDRAYAVAIQPDGKIIAAGSAYNPQVVGNRDFALTRYNTDGSLDITFDGDGKVVTPVAGGHNDQANAVAIQPDGKIVAAGYWDFVTAPSTADFALARYNTDGTLDMSFDSDGKVTTNVGNTESANAISIQPDGKIVAAGYTLGAPTSFTIARYNADGSLDTSFDADGKVITQVGDGGATAYGVAIQSDGKIVAAGSASGGFALVRYNGTQCSPVAFDYDGDRKSDISVFRPSSGAWYLQQTQAGLYGTLFGFGTDKIAPADYDGDGKTDIAVYRPSTGIWYVLNSSSGNVSYHVFGLAEDLPTPADYDGDGKADISVFRPSTGTWYRQNSSDGSFSGVQFGSSEDKPVLANFDGDGKSDIAVFRPSTGAWYWINSSNGSIQGELFGNGSDVLTSADYDGDGKTDLSVYRPSTGIWYSKTSFNSLYTYFIFGLANDIPAPADYDGDGHADICVFRPSDGTWYRNNSSNTQFVAFQFGTNGDKPTQTAFRY